MRIEHHPSCGCCQNNFDFELPRHLLYELLRGDVVIFAGSGISTESKQVLPSTFYEQIADDIGKHKCNLLFSELMEEYCKQPNGRIKLLSEIKDRFDNIQSFPELYRTATRFHKELATLPQIKTILTTNWDTYFEDECGAVPFIFSEDFAFWNTERRKVIKIHGSINNFGSIIATTKDYKCCLKKLRTGVLGSILKSILATKTIVYIGYSFRDEDFQHIHDFVKKQMKALARQAYIVTLDSINNEKYKKLNLVPIVTDGTYFIATLKKVATEKGLSLPDKLYDIALVMLDVFRCAHEQLHQNYNCVKNPEIIYCEFYQDGAMHAYERILAMRNTGRYSCECEFLGTIALYKEKRKQKIYLGRYEDVAYIDGYWSAHIDIFLSLKDKQHDSLIPLFYAYGCQEDIPSIKEYKKMFKKIATFHKKAYLRAKKITKKMDKGGEFIAHHPAYL